MGTWLQGVWDATFARGLSRRVSDLYWCSPYCAHVAATEDARTAHRALCEGFNRYALERITQGRKRD